MAGIAAAAVVAAAGFVAAGSPLVSGQSSEVSGDSQREGARLLSEITDPAAAAEAVDAALATVPPVLPEGMATAKPSVLGKSLDAPSSEEFGYARGLAVATQEQAGVRVDGSAGYEFLSVDVVDDVEPGQRVLEVQSYDYGDGSLVSQKVDLKSGTVTEKRAVGATPGPSERESVIAMDLLISSSEAADVRKAFADLTGEELTTAAQLDFVGQSSVSELALLTVPECETHRCITFQGRSHDGVWLHLSQLVVDLTDKTVRPLS